MNFIDIKVHGTTIKNKSIELLLLLLLLLLRNQKRLIPEPILSAYVLKYSCHLTDHGPV